MEEKKDRPISKREEFLNKLKLICSTGVLAVAVLLGGCGGVEGNTKPTPTAEGIITPTPTIEVSITPTLTAEGSITPTPTVAPTQEAIEDPSTLPYFSVEGIDYTLSLPASDERLANNGKDKDGNDHKNPYMPKGAAWAVLADPGHYRVDSLANVTNPDIKASIERDIRNGAAYEGDDYKDVLTEEKAVVPLMEAGGGAIITGAYAQIEIQDSNGNPIVFQFGAKDNHSWVIIVQNGLDRDYIRGTDNNRSMRLSRYNPGFTMWQGIPQGKFISAQYACQTIADAHGSYRDRGTSPGQGHDGVTTVSIFVAKILPEGVAYTVLQHNEPEIEWSKYKPEHFTVLHNNVVIGS